MQLSVKEEKDVMEERHTIHARGKSKRWGDRVEPQVPIRLPCYDLYTLNEKIKLTDWEERSRISDQERSIK